MRQCKKTNLSSHMQVRNKPLFEVCVWGSMQNKIRQVVIGKFGKKRPSKVPIKHLNAAVFLTTYTEIEKSM